MKFDMNAAWREATGMIAANREVLMIVAGVFFLLPSLAMVFFGPPPPAANVASPEAAMTLITSYYSDLAPLLIIGGIAQAVGMLSLLALLTDRTRPTVAQALRTGAICLLPYIAVQLLTGVAAGLVFLLAIGIGAASGTMALAALLVPLALLAVIYLLIKTSLASPVIVIEGVRNPVNALFRSWQLTKGNSLRLFGFFMLVGVAFLVVMLVVTMVIGTIAALLFSEGKLAEIASGAVSGVIGSVMVVVFVAIMAAVHRQLAGPSAEAISRTFE